MAFPTTLPSYTITAGSETLNTAGGGTGLSGLLNAFEVDITALGTKMGTGSATPALNKVLVGNGTGTSTWSTTLDGLTLTTAVLTAPTITSPAITTPKITTSINDSGNNESIRITATGSAVNDITVINAATANAPQIIASGDDSNIDLKVDAKGTGVVKVQGAVPQKFFALYDFIESGCIITADNVGVNKNYSVSLGVVWLNGKRLTVAAVSAQTVGASKDRYIDLRDNGDGTAVHITNEVANNSASQALTAGDLRLGIVVAGATTIATTGSLNQGQETAVLPIASSVAYSVTDSLGNLINPRDPNRKLLGYKQVIANVGKSNVLAAITGLAVPVIIPTGRKIVITTKVSTVTTDATSDLKLHLYDTSTGGTLLDTSQHYGLTTGVGYSITSPEANITPTATSKTYITAGSGTAGNQTYFAGSTTPFFIKVVLD